MTTDLLARLPIIIESHKADLDLATLLRQNRNGIDYRETRKENEYFANFKDHSGFNI